MTMSARTVVVSCSIAVLCCLAIVNQSYGQTGAPEGAKAYIISPKNGDVVTSPVTVRFGLMGMGVAPAGIDYPDTGHHHLLLDADLPPLNEYIETDHPNYLHYGGGQTEAVLDLEPGNHTLQMLLGDLDHLPHVPPVMSEKISITVE